MTGQSLCTGDGARTAFPLIKSYGDGAGRYDRPLYAVEALTLSPDLPHSIADGNILFDDPPPLGTDIRADIIFDTVVRFETDRLDISVEAFGAGQALSIPLVEVLPHELAP